MTDDELVEKYLKENTIKTLPLYIRGNIAKCCYCCQRTYDRTFYRVPCSFKDLPQPICLCPKCQNKVYQWFRDKKGSLENAIKHFYMKSFTKQKITRINKGKEQLRYG